MKKKNEEFIQLEELIKADINGSKLQLFEEKLSNLKKNIKSQDFLEKIAIACMKNNKQKLFKATLNNRAVFFKKNISVVKIMQIYKQKFYSTWKQNVENKNKNKSKNIKFFNAYLIKCVEAGSGNNKKDAAKVIISIEDIKHFSKSYDNNKKKENIESWSAQLSGMSKNINHSLTNLWYVASSKNTPHQYAIQHTVNLDKKIKVTRNKTGNKILIKAAENTLDKDMIYIIAAQAKQKANSLGLKKITIRCSAKFFSENNNNGLYKLLSKLLQGYELMLPKPKPKHNKITEKHRHIYHAFKAKALGDVEVVDEHESIKKVNARGCHNNFYYTQDISPI